MSYHLWQLQLVCSFLLQWASSLIEELPPMAATTSLLISLPGKGEAWRKSLRIERLQLLVPGQARYEPSVPRRGQNRWLECQLCPSSTWHWSRRPIYQFLPGGHSSLQKWLSLPAHRDD